MSNPIHIPDAPPELAALLCALPKQGRGLVITQHSDLPKPDEWFAGTIADGYGGGDIGPYPSAAAALIAGVQWLYRKLDESIERERALQRVLDRLQEHDEPQPQPQPDRRRRGRCDECGAHAPLNPIHASHSADVQQRLCDACRDTRQRELEAMWRGE